jgi:hypothetical protein
MMMRLAPFISLILLAGVLGQEQLVKQREVNPYNVPDEVKTRLKEKPELGINGSFNPFYISGDFDGDGFTDFAVQVISRKDQSPGILICFANRRTVLLGAGGTAPWTQAETGAWAFDSWSLVRKGGKALSAFPHIKFDALELGEADVGGGIVYWDGQKFRWQREE